MKLTSFAAPLAVLILPILSLADSVSYDQTYDNGSNSLSNVACSNGANGLETRGYTTFGSLPHFPFIGGAAAVAGWNSPNCGTCWNLTYSSGGQSNSVTILAIDHASPGFNIGLGAMNQLTNGQAVQVGRVDAQAVQVAASVCGL